MTEQLPPLPEPARRLLTGSCGDDSDSKPIIPLFTADQLRSYAEQVRAAEREACAQIAEQLSAINSYQEPYYDIATSECASAIRGRG